jgi:hypothetical protein
VKEGRQIPEGLREDYLKYRVDIRVLGVLRNGDNGNLTFVPSHRRLPHVGSQVAFPSQEILRELAGHNLKRGEEKPESEQPACAIGHYALGEYIFGGDSKHLTKRDWMQVKSPEVLVRFRIEDLVSRRSFIFARAGFGKSNLNKLLFSQLYETTPTVTKAQGKKVPVGTIIFDPDGEYFWPDDKGRPGLCDVPHLKDKLVVFTSRQAPSAFYGSFVAGGIKLDIRRLKPGDVIGIALGPERQDQQNVRKLRGLDPVRWEQMVNLIRQYGNQADIQEICKLLDLDPAKQEMEGLAARGNMTAIVSTLHDPSSQLMDMLLHALGQGKLCVVDVSQMRGAQALILSGLILRKIFDRNQQEFTAAEPKTIPTIAVVEEAQSVLNANTTSAEPYIAWVKEGRKYDLGALLVTQQPGSIPVEILSQGDNWFIFHLLSGADLFSVAKANAHYSNDLLSSLLNEPIPGQGVFWSSVGGKPYPVAFRALSFEGMYKPVDKARKEPAIETFAHTLKQNFPALATPVVVAPALVAEQGEPLVLGGDGHGQASAEAQPLLVEVSEGEGQDGGQEAGPGDHLAALREKAVTAFKASKWFGKAEGEGVAWGSLKAMILQEVLPPQMDSHEKDDLAFQLVAHVMTKVYGKQDSGWHSFRTPSKVSGKMVLYVKRGAKPANN